MKIVAFCEKMQQLYFTVIFLRSKSNGFFLICISFENINLGAQLSKKLFFDNFIFIPKMTSPNVDLCESTENVQKKN